MAVFRIVRIVSLIDFSSFTWLGSRVEWKTFLIARTLQEKTF